VPSAEFSLFWFEGRALIAVPFARALVPRSPAVLERAPKPLSPRRRSHLLVCDLEGQVVGLMGLEVLATGRFEQAMETDEVAGLAAGVSFEGGPVPRAHLVAPGWESGGDPS
jgi:hypothetical protein